MSTKVKEALFDLIHSMSKSEKRYFKLMSSRHTIGEENNYVRLFDFLDKQNTYSEEEIQMHFKGEAFLNRFSITKKRLYDHVLTALDSFHLSNSIEAQLYKILHSSDILYEKSLYDQSRRLLISAKKLAQKNELAEIQLVISKKLKRLLETKGHVEILDKDIQEVDLLDTESQCSIQLYNQIWKVKSELFKRLSTKGVARSKDEQLSYQSLCKSLLRPIHAKTQTTENQYLINHTKSAYYYAVGDMESSYKYLKKNLELFNSSKPHLIDFNKQVSSYTNTIYVANSIGQSKESEYYLKELKSLIDKHEVNEDLCIKGILTER